jgi:hypothetical protein
MDTIARFVEPTAGKMIRRAAGFSVKASAALAVRQARDSANHTIVIEPS